MGLKDALEQSTRKRTGFRCSVCKLLDTVDAEDAEALREYLGNPAVQSSQIGRALQAEGHDISQHTVSRHRRGDCVSA